MQENETALFVCDKCQQQERRTIRPGFVEVCLNKTCNRKRLRRLEEVDHFATAARPELP